MCVREIEREREIEKERENISEENRKEIVEL